MNPLDAPNYAGYLDHALSAPDDRQVLSFPESSASYIGFKKWTPAQLRVLVNRAATHYCDQGLKPRRKGEEALNVAIFAPGTLEWAVSFFALARMGHSILVLSARLSDAVVEALLEKSGCQTVIHERPLHIHARFKQIRIVPSQRLQGDTKPGSDLVCDADAVDADFDICWIAHSSGSTGIPKLFPTTQQQTMKFLRSVEWAYEPSGSCLASALYNIVGLRMMMGCLSRSAPIFYDNDRLPFTAEGLLSVMEEIQPEEVLVTPYSLGLIATKGEGVAQLRKAKRVITFGAVCPQALGDKMVREGVAFSSKYGMSEVGGLLASVKPFVTDNEWDWLSTYPWTKDHLEFGEFGSRLSVGIDLEEEPYHLVALPSLAGLVPKFSNCKNPPGSFATGDLFLKHPTKADRWKLVGRLDDQVKIYQNDRQSIVNALNYEDKIKRGNEDIVDEAVLFGQGRNKLGVLIFNQEDANHDKDMIVERVWASIQREINGVLKTGIDKDMIVVVQEDQAHVVPRTVKLNFIRPQVYMKYKDLIEKAYETDDQVTTNGTSKSEDSSRLDLRELSRL